MSRYDSLRRLDDPTWSSYVDLLVEYYELEHAQAHHRRLNRVSDKLFALEPELLTTPGMQERLWQLVGQVRGPARERLLELLTPSVGHLFADGEVLTDPRVDLDGGQLREWPALYVVEEQRRRKADDPEGPYPNEMLDPEDRAMNDYSRLGGAPTRVPGVAIPEAPFLLQIDLRACWENVEWSPRLVETYRAAGLPGPGLLQLFHTFDEDSSMNDELPGGGTTVIYLDDLEALDAGASVDPATAEFRPHRVLIRALPTYSFARAEEGISEELDEAAARLMQLVEIEARYGEETQDFRQARNRDPRTAREALATHLLGAPSLDQPYEEYAELIEEKLPLTVAGDQHRLLLEVASDTVLDDIFGDMGRLQVWVRDSDLRAGRFTEIVSLIRNG